MPVHLDLRVRVQQLLHEAALTPRQQQLHYFVLGSPRAPKALCVFLPDHRRACEKGGKKSKADSQAGNLDTQSSKTNDVIPPQTRSARC